MSKVSEKSKDFEKDPKSPTASPETVAPEKSDEIKKPKSPYEDTEIIVKDGNKHSAEKGKGEEKETQKLKKFRSEFKTIQNDLIRNTNVKSAVTTERKRHEKSDEHIKKPKSPYETSNTTSGNTTSGNTTSAHPGRSKTAKGGMSTVTVPPRAAVKPGKPTFSIVAGNGATLVNGIMTDLGWTRLQDKSDYSFKMRWVECKAAVNYANFRDGEQLINRIPNCNLLTNKMGLLNSLQTYARVLNGTRNTENKLKLENFVPETYRLDDRKERQAFFETYKDGELWICKPTGMNQGKGIFIIRSKEDVEKHLQERAEQGKRRKSHQPLMGRIIQRYILHPLLLEGRKFDIRCYMLVASTVPYLVLFHKGYVRLTMYKYDVSTTDLTAHLTNQYIQKKDPNYKDSKEDTAWSMEKFNDYVNENFMEEKGLEKDWVLNAMTNKMKQIMQYCFSAVKHKLHCQIGLFDLYGLDFMVDNDMQVSLIEVNVNPALSINCEALKEVIPDVVKQTIHIALECFEKSKKKQPLLPLKTENTFQVLHSDSRRSIIDRSKSRARSCSPTKRAHSPPPPPPPQVKEPDHTGGATTNGVHQSGTGGDVLTAKSAPRVRYFNGNPKQPVVPLMRTQPTATTRVRSKPAPMTSSQPRAPKRGSVIQSHVIKDHGNSIEIGEPIKDSSPSRDTTTRPISVKRMSTGRPHFHRRSNQTPSAQPNSDKTVLPVIDTDHEGLKVSTQIQTEIDPEIENLKAREAREEEEAMGDRGS